MLQNLNLDRSLRTATDRYELNLFLKSSKLRQLGEENKKKKLESHEISPTELLILGRYATVHRNVSRTTVHY